MEPIYDEEKMKEMAERFDVNQILKHHAYQNRPLDFDTAYMLGVYTLYPYRESLRDCSIKSLRSLRSRVSQHYALCIIGIRIGRKVLLSR